MAICQTCGTANEDGAVACGQCRSLLSSGLQPGSPAGGPAGGAPAPTPDPQAWVPNPIVPPSGLPPTSPPPSPPRRRGVPVLGLLVGVVAAGLIGLAVGTFILGEVRSEVAEARTNALVEAIEGTWECDVEPTGEKWTVMIARNGAAAILVEQEVVNDVRSTLAWSIEDGALRVGVGGGLTLAEVPDGLEDTLLVGGLADTDDVEIAVDVLDDTNVDLAWESFEVACEKVDSTPPDLAVGLQEG